MSLLDEYEKCMKLFYLNITAVLHNAQRVASRWQLREIAIVT